MDILGGLTVSPSTSTTIFYVNKEDVARFVSAITQNFPEILLSITITKQENSEGYYVRTVTRGLLDATEIIFFY